MLLASAVLMVGIVSVVQLIPASLRSNLENRLDTSATVIAQRELDQMLSRPLSETSFTDNDSNSVSMVGPGSPLVMLGSTPTIDFSAATVPGYSLTYTDAQGTAFEVRWAVTTQSSNGVVMSKRITIACRPSKINQGIFPVTLDTWMHKAP
jgi:Tfp pilus assembly protein PilV